MSDNWNKDELPSWLSGNDDNDKDGTPDENAEQEEDAGTSLPDWLTGSKLPDDWEASTAQPSDAEDPAAAFGSELPEWLVNSQVETSAPRTDDEEAVSPRSTLADQLPEGFLDSADDIAETPEESNLTYDEWMAARQEEIRPKALDEEIPDLLSDAAELDPRLPKVGTGSLQTPDWMLGLEELDDSDAPDWLDEDVSAPVQVPSWLADAPGSQESTPAASGGAFDDDFFADMALENPPADEEPAFDDLFAPTGAAPASGGTSELPDFDTLFSPAAPSNAPVPGGTGELPDLDDLFAPAAPVSGGTSELPDFDTLFGLPTPSAADDDPFAPKSSAAGGTGELPNLDDLFGSTEPQGASTDAELPDMNSTWVGGMPTYTPPAAAADPDDFGDPFADLSLSSDDEAAPAENLSWLEEAGISTELPAPVQPAASTDDLNWMGDDPFGELEQPEAVPAAPAEDLSWLEDDPFAQPEQPAALEPAASTDDLNWMGDDAFGELEQPAAAPAAPAEDLSWLEDDPFAEPEQPAAALTPASEMLDFGSDDDDPFAAIATESETVPEAGGFDMSWLDEAGISTEEQPPAAPVAVPAASVNVEDFDWGDADTDDAAPSFDFEEPTAVAADDLSWLEDLGSEVEAAAAANTSQPAVAADEDDWMGVLDVPVTPRTSSLPQIESENLDDFLSQIGSEELPRTSDLTSGDDFNFDDLFEQSDKLAAASQTGRLGVKPVPLRGSLPEGLGDDELKPVVPDFLQDVERNVGDNSAVAIVRQRGKDRPVEQLTDELQKLRERATDMPVNSPPSSPADDKALAAVLPGVSEMLSPATIKTTVSSGAGPAALSDAQRQNLALLQSLMATDGEVGSNRLSAIDLTYASPNVRLNDDDETTVAPSVETTAAPSKARRRTGRYKIDRLVVSLLLAGLMAAPFFTDVLKLGEPPAPAFVQGSPGLAAFNQVEQLNEGDLVLVAVDYGPNAAPELDGLTDVLLRHILMRGARPVIVGANAVGLLHAENLIDVIAADAGGTLRPNRDYVLVRFVAGDVVGLRSLGANTADQFLTNIRGQSTGLNVNSLDDFALIITLGDQSGLLRGYAEQMAPLTRAPIVAATGFTAAPLVEPYVNAQGFDGLLVGYRDTLTYSSMLGLALELPTGNAPTDIPPSDATDEPTSVPSEEAVVVTDESTEEVSTAEATELPLESQLSTLDAFSTQTLEAVTATDENSPTPEPTETELPSATPTATSTPTDTPEPTETRTPTPTRTPSPTPGPTDLPNVFGEIASNQTVNIRSGPGTDFGVLGTVPSRGRVRVVGRNSDGSWLRVVLEDDTEGWISANLVRILEDDEVTTPESSNRRMNVSKPGYTRQDATSEPVDSMTSDEESDGVNSNTSDAESQGVESMTANEPELQTGEVDLRPHAQPYRLERWYAMTIGTLATILIIMLGALANMVRALSRRRR